MSTMSDAEYSDGDEDMSMDTSPAVDNRKHARAQHNALERRRRDNIKDMYGALKETIPGMSSERASRAVVLRKAIDRIMDLEHSLKRLKTGNDELERTNADMELELARLRGNSQVTSAMSENRTRELLRSDVQQVPDTKAAILSSAVGALDSSNSDGSGRM